LADLKAGNTASLYIHVPFCAGACDYCDFYSIPVMPQDSRLDTYPGAILKEAEIRIQEFGLIHIPTVYIGGGTPSMLGPAGIGRLLSGLEKLWNQGIQAPGEITVEANPESAGEAFLKTCRDQGVTRLSLGIQTFHEPSRRAVHRVGDGALLQERIRLVRDIFGTGFSGDLLTGLPWQDESILMQDMEQLLAYEPGHVSLYALTLESGTPLASQVMLTGAGLPDPDRADALWIAGRDTLEQQGYGQYEVSNFSRPGMEALHNIRYWRMENWLGLGPGASSTIIDDAEGRGRRFTVNPDVDAYISWSKRDRISREAAGENLLIEDLDQLTLIKETFLMGFRYRKGPDAGLFRQRFGLDMETCIPQTIARWRNQGLLESGPLALTKEGLLFLDAFLKAAFREAEKNSALLKGQHKSIENVQGL
jgi:oxygen-independent coproporphyrinogen-3 oxidase